MPNLLTTTSPPPTITAALDWTNIGPLTTIFTPPASCLNNGDFDNGRPFAYIPNRWPSILFVNTNNVECYPPTTSPPTLIKQTTNSKTVADFQHSYFSPGICPSGWYSAADYGPKYAGSPQLATELGEKIAVCCPSGYTAHFESLTTPNPHKSTGSCLSILTSPVSAFICAGCTGIPDPKEGITVDPTVIVTDSTAAGIHDTTLPPSTVKVTARETTILVHWQATDEPMLAKLRAESVEHLDPGSRLTTAQKVGIGIGVAFQVVVIVGLVSYVLRRRARMRKEVEERDRNRVQAVDKIEEETEDE